MNRRCIYAQVAKQDTFRSLGRTKHITKCSYEEQYRRKETYEHDEGKCRSGETAVVLPIV